MSFGDVFENACCRDWIEMAKYLLEIGDNDSSKYTSFNMALRFGRIELANYMIKNFNIKCDISYRSLIKYTKGDNRLKLLTSNNLIPSWRSGRVILRGIPKQHHDIIKWILKYISDVNLPDAINILLSRNLYSDVEYVILYHDIQNLIINSNYQNEFDELVQSTNETFTKTKSAFKI